MTVSEQIDQFIAENGGNTRDALNVALTRLELMSSTFNANISLSFMQGKLSANLQVLDALIQLDEKPSFKEVAQALKKVQIREEIITDRDWLFEFQDLKAISTEIRKEGLNHPMEEIEMILMAIIKIYLPDSQ